jgi:adenosine deaminase
MGFIESMPKIDLHYHLDGGLRPQTVIEIAQKEGIELPAQDAEGITPYLAASEDCKNLAEYLEKFDLPLKCLQSAYAQKRAAKEAVEDAALHNVRYIEVRFAPQLMVDGGLTVSEVTSNVIEGLKAGEAEFKTQARAILVCMRNQDAAKNIEVIETAKGYLGKGVCGADLAGDEAGYPPQLHREAFRLACEYGIPVTIHAGEAGGAENIFEAIENLGAVRIGHGIRLREDRRVFDLAKQKGTALEICVTSNIQTKAAASFETHPVREYFDAGLPVTVNTDNTTVSNTNMTREFEILSDRYGFTHDEMKQLVYNAANVAFLGKTEREALSKKISDEFDALP